MVDMLRRMVYVEEGGNLTLQNSTLEYSQSNGVDVHAIEEQSIINNLITDCTSYGIQITDIDGDTAPLSPEIRDNVINNTNYPIYISSDDGYTGENRITNNTGTGNTHNYIYMRPKFVAM